MLDRYKRAYLFGGFYEATVQANIRSALGDTHIEAGGR